MFWKALFAPLSDLAQHLISIAIQVQQSEIPNSRKPVADVTHWAGCFKASSNFPLAIIYADFPFLNSALNLQFHVLTV